jgi:hypothetical protein
VYPGSFIWGDVRYSAVVLLVNANHPVEAVVKWLCEQVLEFGFGRVLGFGVVVVWGVMGDR